jgi:hypothetical protein
MPLVTELGKAHLNKLNRLTEQDIRAAELEVLALSLQSAMGIPKEEKDPRAIRYEKAEPIAINPKMYMEDDETASCLPTCCQKKKDTNELDESEVQAGDLVEALELELARRLTGQQSAIRNWAKIGLRV